MTLRSIFAWFSTLVILASSPVSAVAQDDIETTPTADSTSPTGVSYGTGGSSDFLARSGTLAFAAGGKRAKAVSVATTHDLLIEFTETFTLNLSGATDGATIADSQGVGSIIDDDEVSPC